MEFLVDKSGSYYFIEMNPRIQVEHTVTEMVTGIDIVRAQILIAGGAPLSHPEIGLGDQSSLSIDGYAIQCRVTTEDPSNNFAPDNGKITSYRSGGGFGVRLDGGNVASGSVISPYYDSLLVKVTSWDITFEAACRKARRAINEEHVRGVKTNIPFVTNILSHPTFLAGNCHTRFIDSTPELFDFAQSKDRATRVLKYIANLQVQNPDAERHEYATPRYPEASRKITPEMGLKHLLDTKGPEAVSKWVLEQKKLLVTDTTMRDAHQSLLATRMRTRDMLKAARARRTFSPTASLWRCGAERPLTPLTAFSTNHPGSGSPSCAKGSPTFRSRCCCAVQTSGATPATRTISSAPLFRRPRNAGSTFSACSTP